MATMATNTLTSGTRLLWPAVLTLTLGLAAIAAQAQSIAPTNESQDWQDTQAAGHDRRGRPWAIVGTWLTTLPSGSKGLITFSADGTVIYSVQGEVSTASNRPSHTSLHGVWRHLGGLTFGYTVWDVWYDATTGQLVQFGKLRGQATIGDDRDEASVRARLQFLDPQGVVLMDRTGTATLARIPFEPLE
ncbi:MAG: hypothetical protein OEW19_01660 [Acidobacteriota bacterium]|nr:hypothetical protein [Acidobacteriota bacterium]